MEKKTRWTKHFIRFIRDLIWFLLLQANRQKKQHYSSSSSSSNVICMFVFVFRPQTIFNLASQSPGQWARRRRRRKKTCNFATWISNRNRISFSDDYKKKIKRRFVHLLYCFCCHSFHSFIRDFFLGSKLLLMLLSLFSFPIK